MCCLARLFEGHLRRATEAVGPASLLLSESVIFEIFFLLVLLPFHFI